MPELIEQLPLNGHSRKCWDAVVVGAGPAGSIAAYRLAAAGHRVLLLDKAAFPRDKTCGDALIPDSLHALDRLGLLGEVRRLGFPLAEAAVFSPSRIEVPVPGEYITLKRRVLDAALASCAVAQGAVFCRGAVADIDSGGDGPLRLSIAGSGEPFRARVAVLATGSEVGLLSRLGMLKREQPSALALRCYVTSPVRLDRLVISYDRSITPGYAWIFPLGGDEYNVGCGVFYRKARHRQVNLREMFHRFLAEFPIAREIWKHACAITPLRGAPLRCSLTGARVLAGNRIVAIGETIGATFPLTGEGIGKAMETAELAANAIHSMLSTGSLRALKELPWRVRGELLPRYIGYEIGERWLSYPWLNDFIAWRVRHSPFLQRLIRGIVAETVDPRRLFSIHGMLESLWR
ncbi:MAG: geranylgeranyl reductase family protein [Acidobacteriota bacterium]